MRVGLVCQYETGVDYHRLLKPFSLLDVEDNGIQIIRCEGANADMFNMGFDVVVFNRMLPIVKQRQFIEELQKRGTYVICDIDDSWTLYHGHIAKKILETYKRQSIEALIYSDEVWVTNEHLGNYVKNLNCNWYVIPNAIDPTEAQWQPKKNYGNRIGWAGGITHFKDLMLTDGCWGDTIPVICGFRDEKEWRRLSDSLKADYINSMDIYSYGMLYDQFDIAIAPLVDNRFNRCKSNLKILEAGIKGLPIFVQDMHPYVDEHQGIYKVNDWKADILYASNMPTEQIRADGQALRSYILDNYDIRKVNEKRKERLA